MLTSYKKLAISILYIASITSIKAQVVKGGFKNHRSQQISLTGFSYSNTFELAKAVTDSVGNFTLNYPKEYKGIALLKTQGKNTLVVILDEPILEIEGTHLSKPNSISFKKNYSNDLFFKVTSDYQKRAQIYKAWHYLHLKYTSSNELGKEIMVIDAIRKEMKRIEDKNESQLTSLASESYLKWYMPKRKLLSDMPESIYAYRKRIPKNIQQFRTIDFTNQNFKTSGLFWPLIEKHYFLLENMGQSLDSIYKQMNVSTDYLIDNLKENSLLLNMVSEKLFQLFEKRSLFSAAAHLSKRLLDESCGCKLGNTLEKNLEKYKTLKIGNLAPDIQLNTDLKLSDLQKNVLLVFGASTCPHCITALQELQRIYPKWSRKMEIVYISLDTDKEAFEKAYRSMPWKTYCDYLGWETKAAKEYFISATPTYVLIDNNMKILQHPNSLEQINAWVDYKL
ncbi:thioredoxin family protein [Flavobacteriaceae bacterium S356]|uniref:Thioredoxin family protein n=1 Tax=Asprobacillus argus TaxID=3076534 RepID=A0ABU3LAY9_9FLAO|nr:thioredoxin family protein [Flavobacteriaceae bacterium S356]